MRRGPWLGRALVGLGLAVLALAVLDVRSAWRPVLTLTFFCVAPGAAIVSCLRLREPLLAASLVIGISVVVSMATAVAMLWAGVSSPVVGAAAVLAVTLGALAVAPARDIEELAR